jgi:hypothetical protein
MKGTIINLTKADVAVVVLCELEEDMPVRGNAMAMRGGPVAYVERTKR